MDYCGPRGIPLDAFLRWSRHSQHAALEWAAYEGQRCKTCGSHPDDWSGDVPSLHAHLAQCKGCQSQQRLAESPEAREGRGVFAALAHGPAASCPRCQPLDD